MYTHFVYIVYSVSSTTDIINGTVKNLTFFDAIWQ